MARTSARRRIGRRRHRRNPGLPLYAQAAVAAGLAVLAFAGVSAGAFALTQRIDPTMATAARNRTIVGAVAVLGGLALAAKKSALYGAGVAAGGLVALAGSEIGIRLTSLLAPKDKSAIPIGAVYGNVGDYEAMGAVYGNVGDYAPQLGAYVPEGMGAVYGNVGDLAPAAPWQTPAPF